MVNLESDYKYLYTIIWRRLAEKVLNKVKKKLMEMTVYECFGCGQLLMFFPNQVNYFYCKDCRERLENAKGLRVTYDATFEKREATKKCNT